MSDGELLERFRASGDEVAFEALVRRHGPMVLRVCRDLLPGAHDAEDAFQATFLVLVRNADSIREADSLGRWLHGVATRVAHRARAHLWRRGALERQGVAMVAATADADPDRHEILPLVHAELDRLPEKFRDPLVLCYLEGRSYEEAAQRLDCPLGTLKGRLSKGRELLRSRLSRRGVAVSALLLMMLLRGEAGALGAAISERLVEGTVQAGMGVLAGAEAAAVSDHIRDWSEIDPSSSSPLPDSALTHLRRRRFWTPTGFGRLVLLATLTLAGVTAASGAVALATGWRPSVRAGQVPARAEPVPKTLGPAPATSGPALAAPTSCH